MRTGAGAGSHATSSPRAASGAVALRSRPRSATVRHSSSGNCSRSAASSERV